LKGLEKHNIDDKKDWVMRLRTESLFFAFSLLLLAYASQLSASQNTHLVNIPKNVSIEKAINASELMVNKRGWKTVEKTSNTLKIQLQHRDYNSNMTLFYTDSEIKYNSETTKKTIEYDMDSAQWVNAKMPASWLKNIKNDIQNKLIDASLLIPNNVSALNDEQKLVSVKDVEERLKSAKSFYEKGLITEKEYELKKNDILSRL